ncbi:MAG TPA: YdiU family protein [Pseudomonadales bacterium]
MSRFHSSFTSALPADPERRNLRRQVMGAAYSWVKPLGFPAAELVSWSRELGAELGVSPDTMGTEQFTALVSGNAALPGHEPYALCYGGHQFGHWAGQLGDGRAINLGEVVTPGGQNQVLQLKGAGPTPYSRGADGLAVLRSSLREYVCSEAMHHLGIPTTRALSLVRTNEDVVRDMFYDGNPQAEPGAIVCRVAPSFNRFGSFEIFTHRGDHELLRKLADYTITTDFPSLLATGGTPDPEVYAEWFHEICRRTADLIVHWMRVGFVHGVMNTDNMSILGLTIDYGPYGWLEPYDPHWTPNTTDAEGRRYRYGAQPQIALWNLVQLANALYPLVNAVPPLEAGIELYKSRYEQGWLRMMRSKLGLEQEHEDEPLLIQQLLNAFSLAETDMTLFFRHLADLDFAKPVTAMPPAIKQAWYDEEPSNEARVALLGWLQRYQQRLQQEQQPADARRAAMHAVNPLYVPRNYLAQLAIEAATGGDASVLEEWMAVLKQPYTEQPGKERFAAKRPEWARHRAGCSMLSCSS